MNRLVYFLLASLILSGCCFSCGDERDSAQRTFKVGKSRIKVTAKSFAYRTTGANRGDWRPRVNTLTVRARVDDRPDFEVGNARTDSYLDEGDLKSMLGDMEWQLSPNGQHLSLQSDQPLRRHFYLLPGGGPAFSTRFPVVIDESKPATDVARETLAAGVDCFNNRDLFRAVSLSGDEALQHELLRACGPEERREASLEDIHAALASSMEGCDAYLGQCDKAVFELCLVARSNPCHERAIAYALSRCAPYQCFEIGLLREYASPEELKRIKGLCQGCP